eukprot:SAG22_NODE_1846_length_3451_cov_2.525358_1_plen_77_part_10
MWFRCHRGFVPSYVFAAPDRDELHKYAQRTERKQHKGAAAGRRLGEKRLAGKQGSAGISGHKPKYQWELNRNLVLDE